MRSFVCLAVVLAGCGASRFRTEHVGITQVGAGGSVTLARGNYQLAMRFEVPRAQIVAWTLQCPNMERTGVVGETFESYRTRRLAELQRMVDQDRRRLAMVTNAIAPHGTATVQADGRRTQVRTQVHVPSGEVIAEEAIQPIVELAHGDVGAGVYTATIHVQTQNDGACTVTTNAIDPIGGTIAVDRIRDLTAEKQERVAVQRTHAIDARMRLRSRLVASGADEHARERRLAEQARLREVERQRRAEIEEAERVARIKREQETKLRLEAEARIKWEAEAPERARRAQLEAKEEEERRARMVIVERERLERIRIIEEERRMRITIVERERTEALRVRSLYVAWLVGTCNADPHRLARIEMERTERIRRIEIERTERIRRIEIERIERERRIEIERGERERRNMEIALTARAQLAGYLVDAGARMRPPRPQMIVEVTGSAPFDGARWEGGTWIWRKDSWQWQWKKGGWVDSVQFGAAGGETVVRAPAREVEPVVVETTHTTTTTVTAPPVQTETAVDVRIPASVTVEVPTGSISIGVQSAPPRVKRDSRTKERARVRDHRRR
jgi:hypothetical protein